MEIPRALQIDPTETAPVFRIFSVAFILPRNCYTTPAHVERMVFKICDTNGVSLSILAGSRPNWGVRTGIISLLPAFSLGLLAGIMRK